MTNALNETHDPARQSFVTSANDPNAEFPIQNLPFGAYCPAPGAKQRIGVAIGDQILDVTAAASCFNGAAAVAAQRCAGPHLNQLMSLGPEAWSALRLGVVARFEHRSKGYAVTAAFDANGAGRADAAGRDRRFHRFLCVGFSCHQRRPGVPAGEPVIAELQIRSGCLSRARLINSGERHGGEAAAGAAQARERGRPDVWAVAQSRFRARTWLLYRRADDDLAKPFRSAGRPSTFSAFASSTTGRRATCRVGSISRSVLFSARISRPPYRLGWSPRKRWRRFGRQRSRGLPAIRNRCRISTTQPIRREGGLDVTLEAYLATETMRRAGTAPLRLTQT